MSSHSTTTIRGEGRVTAGDLAVPVSHAIAVVSRAPRLGSITGQLLRLDERDDFWGFVGRNDVVLELNDGRTWGCTLSMSGGADNRTGISPRP